MDAASISSGPGDPGAGSDGARSVGGPTCSVRRRGSRRGNIRCGGRRRSCHRSRGRRHNCRTGSLARRRSGQRNSLPQPASQVPLSTPIGHGGRGAGVCRLGLGVPMLGSCCEYRSARPDRQEGNLGFGPGIPRESHDRSRSLYRRRPPASGCGRRPLQHQVPASEEVDGEGSEFVGDRLEPASLIEIHRAGRRR